MNINVVFLIKMYIYIHTFLLLMDPFVQRLRQNSFTVKIRVRIPYGLLNIFFLFKITGDVV